MQRLFLLAILFVVILAASLGSFLFISLFPYFHVVGLATAALVIIGLGCVSALLVAFTINRIGICGYDNDSCKKGPFIPLLPVLLCADSLMCLM